MSEEPHPPLTLPRQGTTPSGAGSAYAVELLSQWRNGLRIEHIAQHRSATRCELCGRLLGVGAIVLSAVVGTAIFASLSTSPDARLQIAAGMLSIGAAVLTALQTFLNYPERAERHRKAALAYGALRRKLEQRMSTAQSQSEPAALLSEFREVWDAVDGNAPVVPQRLHNRVVAQVARPSGAPRR
jgi:hypothetical protein